MENDEILVALTVARRAQQASRSVLEAHRPFIQKALAECISLPNIQAALKIIDVEISLTALRAWIIRHEPDLYGKPCYRKKAKQKENKPDQPDQPETNKPAPQESNIPSNSKLMDKIRSISGLPPESGNSKN